MSSFNGVLFCCFLGLLDVEEGKGDAAKGGGAQATKLT